VAVAIVVACVVSVFAIVLAILPHVTAILPDIGSVIVYFAAVFKTLQGGPLQLCNRSGVQGAPAQPLEGAF
jgi:hypothetical protein